MENLTYEALRNNPDLPHELSRRARRERAEAVSGLLSTALRALFSRRRRPVARPVLRTAARG